MKLDVIQYLTGFGGSVIVKYINVEVTSNGI